MNTRHAALFTARDHTIVKPKSYSRHICVISSLKKGITTTYQRNQPPHCTFMAAYTLARVKRIASTAVHVDFKLVFGAAFEQGWFVSSNKLRFFATKCDFCSARLLKKTSTREQQNTSVLTKLLARSTRKYQVIGLKRSGSKHKAPRTVLVTIPDDVNYACMKCLPSQQVKFAAVVRDFRAFQHLCSRLCQFSADLFQDQSYRPGSNYQRSLFCLLHLFY